MNAPGEMIGAPLAQWLVRQTLNPRVAGSNPAAGKHPHEGLADHAVYARTTSGTDSPMRGRDVTHRPSGVYPREVR